MGIMRKTASISTLGLVKYRSDGEQARRIAKQTRNAARAQVAQNQILIANQRAQVEAQVQGNGYQIARDVVPVQPQPALSAGWYPDPTDGRALCWWDGGQWLPHTKHYPPTALPR
jgi:hypothetical protein